MSNSASLTTSTSWCGLPSYTWPWGSLTVIFWSSVLIDLGVITKYPSVTVNVTLLKLELLFLNCSAANPMLYVPAFIPLATLFPLNVKSASWYLSLLIVTV